MTMLLAFNGHTAMGQYIGDTICSIKVAWMFAQSTPCARYLLALSPKGELNFLWQKFIETFNAQVVYDTFDPGNMDQRFAAWDKWHKERAIDGIKFEHYRELYRRIDGGHRQSRLCGSERGLGRKNVFEYLYYGQEDCPESCPNGDRFDDTLIYHPPLSRERGVLIAPYAKCQGNKTFTFDFWQSVVRELVEAGVTVTVNHNGGFCEELNSHPLYRKVFPKFPGLIDEICRHKVVSCGNTGVGWAAGACGVPLLAMQPVDSHMQDYRYEWCGVQSLIDFIEEPDVNLVVERIVAECEKSLVLTTGCYDILHAGHIRHLEESRALGSRLVVCLNSDQSVKRLKGEGRPVHKQDDRAAVLKALRCVDEVCIFDDDDAEKIIKKLCPGVITNGPDHKAEEVVGKAFVEGYGGRVVITSDRIGPSTTEAVKKVKGQDVLKAIRDASHLSVNPFGKLKLMADQALSVKDVPGDVADLGVYRGGTSLILRRILPEKTLHLFDTWTGNPHSDPLCHHKAGEWAADLKEVQKLLPPDEKTVYHVGVFPASAGKWLEEDSANICGFAFAYIDGDTYQTTRDAIVFFWPRLKPGGRLFFDDYDWTPCAGVKKAVDEEFPEGDHRIEKQIHAGDHACVIVKSSSPNKERHE